MGERPLTALADSLRVESFEVREADDAPGDEIHLCSTSSTSSTSTASTSSCA